MSAAAMDLSLRDAPRAPLPFALRSLVPDPLPSPTKPHRGDYSTARPQDLRIAAETRSRAHEFVASLTLPPQPPAHVGASPAAPTPASPARARSAAPPPRAASAAAAANGAKVAGALHGLALPSPTSPRRSLSPGQGAGGAPSPARAPVSASPLVTGARLAQAPQARFALPSPSTVQASDLRAFVASDAQDTEQVHRQRMHLARVRSVRVTTPAAVVEGALAALEATRSGGGSATAAPAAAAALPAWDAFATLSAPYASQAVLAAPEGALARVLLGERARATARDAGVCLQPGEGGSEGAPPRLADTRYAAASLASPSAAAALFRPPRDDVPLSSRAGPEVAAAPGAPHVPPQLAASLRLPGPGAAATLGASTTASTSARSASAQQQRARSASALLGSCIDLRDSHVLHALVARSSASEAAASARALLHSRGVPVTQPLALAVGGGGGGGGGGGDGEGVVAGLDRASNGAALALTVAREGSSALARARALSGVHRPPSPRAASAPFDPSASAASAASAFSATGSASSSSSSSSSSSAAAQSGPARPASPRRFDEYGAVTRAALGLAPAWVAYTAASESGRELSAGAGELLGRYRASAKFAGGAASAATPWRAPAGGPLEALGVASMAASGGGGSSQARGGEPRGGESRGASRRRAASASTTSRSRAAIAAAGSWDSVAALQSFGGSEAAGARAARAGAPTQHLARGLQVEHPFAGAQLLLGKSEGAQAAAAAAAAGAGAAGAVGAGAGTAGVRYVGARLWAPPQGLALGLAAVDAVGQRSGVAALEGAGGGEGESGPALVIDDPTWAAAYLRGDLGRGSGGDAVLLGSAAQQARHRARVSSAAAGAAGRASGGGAAGAMSVALADEARRGIDELLASAGGGGAGAGAPSAATGFAFLAAQRTAAYEAATTAARAAGFAGAHVLLGDGAVVEGAGHTHQSLVHGTRPRSAAVAGSGSSARGGGGGGGEGLPAGASSSSSGAHAASASADGSSSFFFQHAQPAAYAPGSSATSMELSDAYSSSGAAAGGGGGGGGGGSSASAASSRGAAAGSYCHAPGAGGGGGRAEDPFVIGSSVGGGAGPLKQRTPVLLIPTGALALAGAVGGAPRSASARLRGSLRPAQAAAAAAATDAAAASLEPFPLAKPRGPQPGLTFTSPTTLLSPATARAAGALATTASAAAGGAAAPAPADAPPTPAAAAAAAAYSALAPSPRAPAPRTPTPAALLRPATALAAPPPRAPPPLSPATQHPPSSLTLAHSRSHAATATPASARTLPARAHALRTAHAGVLHAGALERAVGAAGAAAEAGSGNPVVYSAREPLLTAPGAWEAYMARSSCVLVREVGGGAAGYSSSSGGGSGSLGGAAHAQLLPAGLCSDGVTVALGALRVGREYAFPMAVKNTSPFLRRVRAVAVGWDALPSAPRAALALRWRALPLPPGLSAPATLLLRAGEPGLLSGALVFETDDGEVLQARVTAVALSGAQHDALRAACSAVGSLEPLLRHTRGLARAAGEWDGEHARQGAVDPRSRGAREANSELGERPGALARLAGAGGGSGSSSRGGSRGSSRGGAAGAPGGAAGALGATGAPGELGATFPASPGANATLLPPGFADSAGLRRDQEAGLASTMRAASARRGGGGSGGGGSGGGDGGDASPTAEILSLALAQGTTPHQLLEAALVRQSGQQGRDSEEGDGEGGEGSGSSSSSSSAAAATVARAMVPVAGIVLDGRAILPELHDVERLAYPEARADTAARALGLQGVVGAGEGGEGGGWEEAGAPPPSPGWRAGGSGEGSSSSSGAGARPLDKDSLLFPLGASHRLLIAL